MYDIADDDRSVTPEKVISINAEHSIVVSLVEENIPIILHKLSLIECNP